MTKKMYEGDILLFKGTGVFSTLITALPGAEYSHVGLVYRHEGSLCVFESTSLGVLPDAITGAPIDGVQIVPLRQRIASYEGEVFLRPVIGNRDEYFFSLMSLFVETHHGKPYEQSNWQLASAELDLLPWHANKEDDSSLFCSETAVMLLRELGVIEFDGQPPNEFTPTDLADNVTACEGFQFGAITQIK